ncbi:hypothetical protein K2173_026344 [Erythroxylum novogranatense]|uniref:Copia protein n=1 Tax=Erythroxylum novogranatense TaxID=1862640 RepID=A0AAV8SNN1_9ROSI|nr:hypothetical protein K2173_026344 [Erythroxylum novogranatense]
MFLGTAKDIWEAIRQTYSKVNDAAQIYEIRTKVSATKQESRNVTEYSSLIQSLWQEMDHYQCIQMRCSEDAENLKRFVEKNRIYDFLAGLNVEFDAVRTIAIIRAEEGRRSVMLEPQGGDGSALITKSMELKEAGHSTWEGPMRLYCDNKSAISIAHNPVQHDRTKHIEVDRHFIKEKLDSGLICTPFVSTKDQLEDVLTKGLTSIVFQDIISKLGMEDIPSPA